MSGPLAAEGIDLKELLEFYGVIDLDGLYAELIEVGDLGSWGFDEFLSLLLAEEVLNELGASEKSPSGVMLMEKSYSHEIL